VLSSNARQYYYSERVRQEILEKKREAERRAELEKIKKEEAKALAAKRDRRKIMAVILVCFALAFAFTYLEANIVACGYELNNTKAEIADVNNQIDRIKLKIEDSYSLASIEDYAINTLGMVYPDSSSVAYMQFDEINPVVAETEAESEEPVATISVDEESGFFREIYHMVADFFNGSAHAAEK